MTTPQKIAALNSIALEIRSFKGLEIARNAINSVPGEGSPDARIFFIGEAPGELEDQTGRPFVGRSGQLMRTTLTQVMGIVPEEIFITNIVKFRPPANRDPTESEIEACREWLDRQIQIIEPKVIVTLGRFSMAKFIHDVTISKIHGQPRFSDFSGQKIMVFPMYHPAAALRATAVLTQFKEDFQKLYNLLYPGAVSSAPIPTDQATPDPQLELFG